MDFSASVTPVFFVLLSVIASCSSLSVTSCGSSDVIRVNKLDLRPSKLQGGQPATLHGEWEILGDIKQPIRAETRIFKEMFFGIRIQIPCSNNGGSRAEFGSCTYNDTCQLLKSSSSLCDFSKGVHQGDLNFKVPSGGFLTGNYDLELKVSDGNGRQLGCWKATVGLQ
ncbi:hypothetical protein RvY_05524 [Ramazzottius varieornatus]|uniref:MD-2-related lipid-recognition domain-containing protein n=1 Tax=Ramazzottius varieornatus TaxID=947166 RepID=A0A1D1UYV7_RAMVA|nr:hypothetical protein RvY_05524 [Ramazzottius varieornatus]